MQKYTLNSLFNLYTTIYTTKIPDLLIPNDLSQLRRPLPIDLLREELVDKTFVIRPQLYRIRPSIRLGVQVVRVERQHVFQCLLVFLLHQVLVGAFPVPRVEGVVPDHVECRLRQCRLFLADHVLRSDVVISGCLKLCPAKYLQGIRRGPMLSSRYPNRNEVRKFHSLSSTPGDQGLGWR